VDVDLDTHQFDDPITCELGLDSVEGDDLAGVDEESIIHTARDQWREVVPAVGEPFHDSG
jgi:hypothetical protein